MSDESPPEGDEIQLGAAGLVARPTGPPAPQGTRTLREARRQAKRMMREASELDNAMRKCRGKVKLRDGDGNYLRNDDGTVKTRPCKGSPIRGGFVCPKHGGSAPQVKKKAEKRLNAMLEPSIIRMDYLMHQDEHLPTSLAAVLAVQNRVLGAVGKEDGEKNMRPVINIGIKVGGVPMAQPQIEVVTVEAEEVSVDDDSDD
jgi:hypothetical protein